MYTSMSGARFRLLTVLLVVTLVALIAVGAAQSEGSAQANGSLVRPGESIQKAINAADPGDTIMVKGVHREDVVIRKNGIKLRGVGNAVIEVPPRAKADSPCSKAIGPVAICVLGDFNLETGEITGQRVRDVSVSGFTFRGFTDTFMMGGFAARNATVEGNRITGNVATGIAFEKSVNTTIAKNHVIGKPDTFDIDIFGILVASSSRTKIVNNVVRSYDYGVDFDESTNTTIAGNDFIGNSFTGISVFDSPGTKILSNDMIRSGILGTLMFGPKLANAKVVGNNILGKAWGIYVTDTKGGGSFAANTIRDNCAGMFFEAFPSEPVGGFEVKGNTVEDNTRSCRAAQFDRNFSGIGIALLGARGMEVKGNHLSGNVPSGPTPVSGGVVVATTPFFGETIKPKNNTVTGNHFGRNKPDIFWDESGSANRFVGNLCNTSVPARLCS